jgi:sn-glycerol 3-phosphate transport system ATP-binding protein
MVGPSGCGKSTCCAWWPAWRPFSAGEIAIGERVVNRIEPKDRDIAMVFQNYALYPHMNVRENMAYGLKIRGLPQGRNRHARGKRAAEILELGPYSTASRASSPAASASAWPWAAPSCASRRCSCSTSRLSNLDAKLRVQMRAELQALHRRLSTTSLYVTHDQVEAMTLAQRMMVMNAGRAEQIGAPLEVYEKPATTFVAGFIGSPPMNLIPTQRNGRDILLGVRPEHLEPCSPGEAMMTVEVDLVEPLGSDTLVYGRIGGHASEARVAVRLHQSFAAHTGSLPVRYERTHEHHFDAGTGLRIED